MVYEGLEICGTSKAKNSSHVRMLSTRSNVMKVKRSYGTAFWINSLTSGYLSFNHPTMQIIKEEWIGIYLANDNNMHEVIFCTIDDYLPSCDNNEVFHILGNLKLFQINPYLVMVAHQNQVNPTLDLAIKSTCKHVWMICTKKGLSKTTFHMFCCKLSMIEFDPTWWKSRDRSTIMYYTLKKSYILFNKRTSFTRNISKKWAPTLPSSFKVK